MIYSATWFFPSNIADFGLYITSCALLLSKSQSLAALKLTTTFSGSELIWDF